MIKKYINLQMNCKIICHLGRLAFNKFPEESKVIVQDNHEPSN